VAGERLDDERERQPELTGGRLGGGGSHAVGHRQAEALREPLEAPLVDEVFDQLGVGEHEAQPVGELLPVPRDREEVPVALEQYDRGLGLARAERGQLRDKALRLGRRVDVRERRLDKPRARRQRARSVGHRARHAGQAQRPEQIHVAGHTRQRPRPAAAGLAACRARVHVDSTYPVAPELSGS
jgi:hypothetical protein